MSQEVPYGVDSAFPPAETLTVLPRFWAGYGASPEAFHAWPVEDFLRVALQGVPVLPITVLPSTPTPAAPLTLQTVCQLRRAGLQGSLVALDTEAFMASDWGLETVARLTREWCQAVSDAGLRPLVYGGAWTAEGLPGDPSIPCDWWLPGSLTGPRTVLRQGGQTVVGGVQVDQDWVEPGWDHCKQWLWSKGGNMTPQDAHTDVTGAPRFRFSSADGIAVIAVGSTTGGAGGVVDVAIPTSSVLSCTPIDGVVGEWGLGDGPAGWTRITWGPVPGSPPRQFRLVAMGVTSMPEVRFP